MINKYGLILMVILLILGGFFVYLGRIEQDVSLSSVLEVWSDVVRDIDQFGLRLTHISDEKEMELGRELAAEFAKWSDFDRRWEPYIGKVGQKLAPKLFRKGIKYEFHVIKYPWINAFALPGGQIYITTDMLELISSEAELSAILGHEMAHVDLFHCIEMVQYENVLKSMRLGEIGRLVDLLRESYTSGYRKYQEIEADAHGVFLMSEAGYNPKAVINIFDRLKSHFGRGAKARGRTPVGEAVIVLEDMMGSYFQTHPMFEDRIRRLRKVVAEKIDSSRHYFDGVDDYEKHKIKLSEDLGPPAFQNIRLGR